MRPLILNIFGKSSLKYFNHKYKIIFTHIPKTGGQSIANSLFNTRFPGHYSYKDYFWEYGENINKYFFFTVVREPLGRIKSAYYYLLNSTKIKSDQNFANCYLSKYSSFDEFVRFGLKKDEIQNWIHFKTQTSFLVDNYNQINYDFIGKFENLDNFINDLKPHIKSLYPNIDKINLKKINVSGSLNASLYLSKESKRIINDVYFDDFKNFNYPLLK